MKLMRIVLPTVLIAIVVFIAPLSVAPAQAASPATVTPQTVRITEAQINASYWVTNPARRSVTNRHVTLGDGIVTIDATITHRDGKTFDAQTVWKPYITSHGVLVFGFQSATVSGATASSADRITLRIAHQYAIRDAIRDYIRKQVGGPFKYVSIAVTPGLITVNVNVYTRTAASTTTTTK